MGGFGGIADLNICKYSCDQLLGSKHSINDGHHHARKMIAVVETQSCDVRLLNWTSRDFVVAMLLNWTRRSFS